ncbi:hypothetical protein [Natronococcus jeotgali]|uniref:DUF8112 domain-containing protein n=1 Tax=Natronococcus jeotgali DSM 18795 TaxID=1227498 RepID=L9XNR3_9EURY|nr:hypothetical protein [Natronococcus jeotgali]ELY63395.1 hypothetical protein C492_07135 [Natronococcus jeotgali DSM 18795]
MLLEATPTQLLEGLSVGTQGSTHCQWCDYEFYEGDTATVLISRPADADCWIVHRAYCASCDPSAIAGPTLGCTELLARCRLGTRADLAAQQTELVVLEPKLQDASEPAESQSALETDEDTDPASVTQSLETEGVEIETLPPRLRTSDSRAD